MTGGLGKLVKVAKAIPRFTRKVDSARQAGHIRGTANYKNRLNTHKGESSAFLLGRRFANFNTRLGNQFGRLTNPKQSHIRTLRLPYPVSRSQAGKLQWTVRVSAGKNGMHGTPWH